MSIVVFCQKCDKDLVSKLEKNINLCFDCVLLDLKSYKELKEEHSIVKYDFLKLLEANSILLDAKNKREKLESSFKSGKEAFKRGFSIEDDLNPINSEESVMWKSGWLEEAKEAEAEEMREFIRWDMNLWLHVNELVLNGCNLDELGVKTKLAPIKAMKFLPEFLNEEEK